MIPLLSRSSVRAFDARSIEVGVPGIVLMENAGRGAAEAIARRAPARSARVVLACGTGNNGGDGFVVARQLVIMGYEPRVFLIGALERVTATRASPSMRTRPSDAPWSSCPPTSTSPR